MNLNRAMIIGNLTRDPESRTTTSGKTVTSFSVATNSNWTDASGNKQVKVEYHNIVAWGKLGEICQQYLGKGRKVYVEGRLQTREWEGQDGIKRHRTEIIAENMILLDRASQSAGARPVAAAVAGTLAAEAIPVIEVPPEAPTEEIKVEDIPF
jgi:single-strand DNA-binding protein